MQHVNAQIIKIGTALVAPGQSAENWFFLDHSHLVTGSGQRESGIQAAGSAA